MDSFAQQLRLVFRRLRRAPLFTAITLITLAAGVGANTVVFSVLEGVLLKPLPYPHAEELVGVWHSAPGLNITELIAAPSNYFIYREQNHTFQDIGLYNEDSVSITGLAEPEQVHALKVTDGTLPILGIPPVQGRVFTREDDLPGTPETVVITYGYWQRRFGGSPSVIGQSIMVDGKPRQIIGVMPQRFHFLDMEDPAVILPFKFDRSKTMLGNFSYQAVARLRPGATIAAASADVARMLPIVNSSFPAPPGFSLKLFEQARIEPNLRPFKQVLTGDVGKTLWVLMGSIGMVLLIACANVANLLLVRVEGRRQELAVRSALGAGRGRIAAELLFESVVVGLLGSVLGLALAYLSLRLLVAIAPEGLPRINEIGINFPVLLFTLGIALFASVLFGSIPILKYAGTRLGTSLREGGRALSQSRGQHRARNILVVVQVALALVLLISSGLMIRTFRALTQVRPGFNAPAEIQTFRLSIPEAQVAESERAARMYEQITRKIAAIPGVTSVALSSTVPMDGQGSFDPIFPEGRNFAEGELPPIRRFKYVSPGLIATLGTPFLAGRDFTWNDIYGNTAIAIVTESLAREYWGSPSNALGKRMRVGTAGDWKEIIGVVADVYDDGVNKEPVAAVYWPFLAGHMYHDEVQFIRNLAVVIRSPRTGSQAFMKEVSEAVWSVNPNLPLAGVDTLQYFYAKSLARTSFTLVMLGVAGGMALLLGIVGIYGVTAVSVSQRTREIGIRMALGAQQRSLTSMFVRHGLWLTGIGVACGLVASFALMRLMSSLLFRVSPADPLSYAGVSCVLVATSFLASYLASRRASSVDPVEALRAE
jgi:predicted permease